MPLYGDDIAGSYQAGFDVATAARDGRSFSVCKISEGTVAGTGWDEANLSWATRWIGDARRLGLIPGGYHYLRGGDGAAQARHFHARITALGGPAGMLIQLDNEADADWHTTAPAGEATGADPDRRRRLEPRHELRRIQRRHRRRRTPGLDGRPPRPDADG